ncbi:MAG: PorV/PorQ family protein [bacterium]
MKKTLVIIGIFCIIIITALATSVRAEKTFGLPNDYLQYGAGARSLAMGGAYTGVSDDASAAYWNPAGLAYMEEFQLVTMYAPFNMDTHFNFASIAVPLGPLGSFAVSDVMLLSGDFQERNDLNQITGEDKSVMKNTASASYAYPFYNNRFSAGARVKFIQERVFSTAGDAFGFDLSLYSKPYMGISLGLAANNINRPKITLTEAPDIYGRNLRFGAAYHAKKDLFVLAIDANKLEEQNMYYTMGLEVNPHRLLSLRTGLNQQGVLTAGVGINIWPFKVDYAFSNHEEMGTFNKVSLTFRWGNVYESKVEPLGKNIETGSIYLKGLYNELVFKTSISKYIVKRWSLVIYDKDKTIVREISGESRPAEKIIWDMVDTAGNPVKRGTYFYTFNIDFKNDKTWVNKGDFTLDYSDAYKNSVNIQVKGDEFIETNQFE